MTVHENVVTVILFEYRTQKNIQETGKKKICLKGSILFNTHHEAPAEKFLTPWTVSGAKKKLIYFLRGREKRQT